jgi:hypothetical protein
VPTSNRLLRLTLPNHNNFGASTLILVGKATLAAFHLAIDRTVIVDKVNLTHTDFAF